MILIEIFVPLIDGENWGAGDGVFQEIRSELIEKFGGLTMYSRAPARGYYRTNGKVDRDDLVVVEVMTDDLDREWWHGFRRRLESRLRQEEVLVRAREFHKL
jgi:hypothetical protein